MVSSAIHNMIFSIAAIIATLPGEIKTSTFEACEPQQLVSNGTSLLWYSNPLVSKDLNSARAYLENAVGCLLLDIHQHGSEAAEDVLGAAYYSFFHGCACKGIHKKDPAIVTQCILETMSQGMNFLGSLNIEIRPLTAYVIYKLVQQQQGYLNNRPLILDYRGIKTKADTC